MPLKLRLLRETFAVCRLSPEAAVPDWAGAGSFFSVTRTPDELSIVSPDSHVPKGILAERGWRCIKIQGPLPFSLTGVLASLVAPLAEAKVSVFAFSTYDTDYVLVKEAALDAALSALARSGHSIEWD